MNYNFDSYVNIELLAKKVSETLELLNVAAKVIKTNEKYEIIPSNVALLDEALIHDNLSWLEKYPDTKEHINKSLTINRKESNYRNIVDELRLSLEIFLKLILRNKKSLENQNAALGEYFKKNNISTIISNMYIKLVDFYSKYNNGYAKHGDNVEKVEIDYLTGIFIRFIMQVEKQKIEVKFEEGTR